MEWKLIDVFNICPAYEISPNGDIRRLGTKRLMKGVGRVYLTLRDGTYKHFFRSKLVEVMYPEYQIEHIMNHLDDDMVQLMSDVEELFKTNYDKISFTIQIIWDNMISVESDKFKYPFSIKKEGDNQYIIRTGKRWKDLAYYNKKPSSKTFISCDADELMYTIQNVLYNKIKTSPAINPNEEGCCIDCPITDEECAELCQIFIKNGFQIHRTMDEFHEVVNKKITYKLMRNIVTKQICKDVTDLYFDYIGNDNRRVSFTRFILTEYGKEFIE